MNSGLKDILLALALMSAIMLYDIKSKKINIRDNLSKSCRIVDCSKSVSKLREINIEKRYRKNLPMETAYVDFGASNPKGSASQGTAFVINKKILLSARHVINCCRKSYVIDWKNNAIPIVKTEIQDGTDLALLYTKSPLSPSFFLVDSIDIDSNKDGFHFGFPQEKSGQVYSHFLGQAKMISSRGYKVSENVLVWSVERQSSKALSGISGGPIFNQDGALVGVSIAESLRRGRAYSSDPQTNKYIVDNYQVIQNKDGAKKIYVDLKNYENLNKELQRDNMIVKVICFY